MKPFYENTRDDKPYSLIAKNQKFLNYPSHFHGVLELFIVKKGPFVCYCNGKKLTLKNNSIAIFDHFDLHYIPHNQNQEGTFQYVMTIPSKLLTKFNALRQNESFATNVICDEQLCDTVISLIDTFFHERSERTFENEAVIDLIFSQIFYKMEFVKQEKKSNDFYLIKKILIYIENNYKENVSRKEIAKNLGYTESHISRTFHQYIGYSIPHYTHHLRLSYNEKNLKKKDVSLTQLIMDSGFKSLQSYYRNKKLFENFNPSTNPKI